MGENWTLERVQQLITDKVQENLHLDYKAAAALAKTGKNPAEEISKDVSAMANSDGGTIIYGLKEGGIEKDGQYAENIDPIDQKEVTREWLEQIINSNIYPRINGIVITPIPSGDNQVIYVVEIPKGETAHQAKNHKYYKRYNFTSQSMYDHEIRDVMGRNRNPKLDISLTIQSKNISVERQYYFLCANITNIGSVYAKYINIFIEFPRSLREKNVNYYNDIFLWQFDNTIKDRLREHPMVIKSTDRFSGVKFSEGQPRYVPILPGLSREWEIELPEFLDVYNYVRPEKITWKIYADNALPVIGEVVINDLPLPNDTLTGT